MTGRRSGAALPAIVLAALWLDTWWRQHWAWSGDPELMFGWAVPALVIFLFSERWLDRPAPVAAAAGVAGWWGLIAAGGTGWCASLLFLEAYPLWTLFLWLQTVAAVLLTLGCLGFAGGRKWVLYFAFPLLFSFTALPWPATLHQNLGQALMATITKIATFVLNEGGIPAVAAGNIIKISRAWVGVEEACSGLRSLQAGIMMALFLGEYHRFDTRRRLALTGAALVFALISNLLRTLWLTWQAALHGPDAVQAWHDTAGYAALAFNAVGLALLSWLWIRAQKSSPPPVPRTAPVPSPASPWTAAKPALCLLAVTLLIGETSVKAWYSRGPEVAASRHLASWKIAFPKDAADFKAMDFTPAALAMLSSDQVNGASWKTPAGISMAGYVVDWSNRLGGPEIARLHNPLICLPASGARLLSDEGLQAVELAGQTEQFHFTRFTDGTQTFAVFFTVIQAGQHPIKGPDAFPSTQETWWRQRWTAVSNGRRPGATRLLALAFWQLPPGTEVDTLRATIKSLVQTDFPPAPTRSGEK